MIKIKTILLLSATVVLAACDSEKLSETSVIDEGKIAEQGTHNELLERKGLYAGMWSNFQKGIEWKV